MVKWKEWYIVAIYLSPKLTREEFEERLEEIEEEVREKGKGKTIVAGDFNAKAKLWGSDKECRKGKTLCEWAAAMDLKIINKGGESTYRKGKNESVIDLTWGLGKASREIKGWRIIDRETLSDHVLIQYVIGERSKTTNSNHRDTENKWAIRKLDMDKLSE